MDELRVAAGVDGKVGDTGAIEPKRIYDAHVWPCRSSINRREQGVPPAGTRSKMRPTSRNRAAAVRCTYFYVGKILFVQIGHCKTSATVRMKKGLL